MPEIGRPSASSGNAYQDVRVASRLIDLLTNARLISVAVETLDETDDLVVQCAGGRVWYEQVKERAPGGRWTARRLCDEEILRQFVQQHRINANCDLALFTGSDASDFREVTERARNASANHSSDERARQSALAEWERRLGRRHGAFVDQILRRMVAEGSCQPVTRPELFEILVCVRVLDASGTINQLRERCVERLQSLVDDPNRALVTLEGLAREAAIRRRVIRRRELEIALEEDDTGPRFASFAISIDAEAYEAKILDESAAVDIAKLKPLVPNLDSPSELAFNTEAVSGKTLLQGGHGVGKSRFATDLVIKSIRSGRQCLHIRLARWATTLRDLLVAELSRAASRHARIVDVENLFCGLGALVLDGLDEVPGDQRSTAEREILQFADIYPHVDILVTTRPGSGHSLSELWQVVELCSLTSEQIERALGRDLNTLQLERPIVALAGNPLMLGLLARQLAIGVRPSSEADLLDAFVTEVIERESLRIPSIDSVSGHRLAEDAAFEWLSSGRVALSQSDLREVAASVARTLRETAFLQTDAAEVEHWLVEAGLAVRLGTLFVPVHRAILDHLAGRSMARRDAVRAAGVRELREAVARYLGSQTKVSEPMLSLLSAIGKDLELLARGKRLTSQEIFWPFDSERFAMEYLAQLRRLGRGPLFDVGVVGQAIEIDIDRDMTWISEKDRVGAGDVANVVATPDRPRISIPGESNTVPVLTFRSAGYRGAVIDKSVPHYAALDRAGDELRTLVEKRALPDEGPDIVYERLCSLAKRFIRTVTIIGMRRYEGFYSTDSQGLTATEFQAQFLNLATELGGAEALQDGGSATFIAFSPVLQRVVVAKGPKSTVHGPGSHLGVHYAVLMQLLTEATRLEIHELPLHPLELLPDSETDPILSLPRSKNLLHGDSLGLYVERHEYGKIRALRYLVENNLHGLSPLLRTYSTLPWRTEMAIEDQSNSTEFELCIRYITRRHCGSDQVAVVSEIVENDDFLESGSSSIHAYSGVLTGAYERLNRDVMDLLGGTNPLGSQVL